jgi:hypothetical protein
MNARNKTVAFVTTRSREQAELFCRAKLGLKF